MREGRSPPHALTTVQFGLTYNLVEDVLSVVPLTQANLKIATFADYLAHDDGTDRRYELTYGELIEVPPESDENVLISRALDLAFSEIVEFQRVRTHQLAIEVLGQPKNRFPDLTVLRPEHLEQLRALGQSAIASA